MVRLSPLWCREPKQTHTASSSIFFPFWSNDFPISFMSRYSIERKFGQQFPFRIESSVEYHSSSSTTASVTIVASYNNKSLMKLTNISSIIPLPSLELVNGISHSARLVDSGGDQSSSCTVTGHTSREGFPEIIIQIPKLKSNCQLYLTITLNVRSLLLPPYSVIHP